jgi:hypothetical protein
MRWFAEYLESAENRRKLTIRLGLFMITGGVIFNAVVLYLIIFVKK